MGNFFRFFCVMSISFACSVQAKEITAYVNPFIGTTNFGTCHPGAVSPNGMMSVVPFNVTGSADNTFDKDARWWSTPYEYTNVYFTGFSHVNLSGVGCPELGSLLLMPTTGDLNVDYREYGSKYLEEKASPGYYSNKLIRYGVKTEVSATPRTGISRFTFPAGKSNILLNLGSALTNESGAFLRRVSDTEIEGMKLQGTFCYNPQAVFPIYFVMQLDKKPVETGYWKKQPEMYGVEAEWDVHSGKYKLYTKYNRELAGDDIGAWFTFDTEADEAVEVRIGVSFVSIENARENLEKERKSSLEETVEFTRQAWEKELSRIEVKGGTEDERTIFYTSLYHTLIHPNILQDVNGQYPAMETGDILHTDGDRYTVFSLWDTYRNVHQLLTLVYPEKQTAMINTMLDMYREHGWLPKWELFGRETLTMEGDPSIPVIVDSWMKGLRNFDVEVAYEAMCKGAFTSGKNNLMRPDNDDYLGLGFVPLREQYDNSVSHALEYYIADYALATFAEAIGKKDDAKRLYKQAAKYKNYYCNEYGTFRPLLPNGKFLSPFDPKQGENFEPSPGFHEGNSWNYTFYVPHDVYGLAKLMGGKKKFIEKLQMVFDQGLYDPANEPDIAYPYLFSYFPGEEWRTQKEVSRLLKEYFRNTPDGLPGNDDTGTMSSWALFSMMGFYPDCPGKPEYTLTTPVFDEVVIHLNPEFYKQDKLVIRTNREDGSDGYIRSVSLKDKPFRKFRMTHDELVNAGTVNMNIR